MTKDLKEARGYHVLAYHMVEPRFDLGITRVTPHQFERHVEALAEWGFHGVRLSDLVSKIGPESQVWTLPETRPGGAPERPRSGPSTAKSTPRTEGMEIVDAISLTFDDAYLSVYTWAFPVLLERGWTGTIFPVVGYIGKDNRWDGNLFGFRFPHVGWSQLRELVQFGWEVGSHGMTHSYLNWLDGKTLRRELEGSKKTLEDKLGVEVRALCAPYGRASRRVVDEALTIGYDVVCLLDGVCGGVEKRGHGLVVHRKAVYWLEGVDALRAKLALSGLSGVLERGKQSLVCAANVGGVVAQFARQKGLAIFRRFAKIGSHVGG